jgi:hypothetical protein
MSSLFQTAIALCQIERHGDIAIIVLPQKNSEIEIDGSTAIASPLQLLRWLTCPSSHNRAINWKQSNKIAIAIVRVDEKISVYLS